jgi:hypothetical protein
MYFASRMPCAECGAVVERADAAAHVCDPARWRDFQLLTMSATVAGFDTGLQEYLAGKEGRFEAWLAARDVRRTA